MRSRSQGWPLPMYSLSSSGWYWVSTPDRFDAGIDAVGKRKINDAVFAAIRHRRLCQVLGQHAETAALLRRPSSMATTSCFGNMQILLLEIFCGSPWILKLYSGFFLRPCCRFSGTLCPLPFFPPWFWRVWPPLRRPRRVLPSRKRAPCGAAAFCGSAGR